MMGFNISPETLVKESFPGVTIDKVVDKLIDTSLYPDYSICPNGSMYKREHQGFIPAILEEMFEKRKQYKNLQIAAEKEYEKTKDKKLKYIISNYKVKQLSLKVCLNSGYGALGNNYGRFYELRNAEAITTTGQVALKWIQNKLNLYFNNILKTKDVDYCIYGDTDSVMLNVQPLIEQIFEDKNTPREKIVNFIDKIFSTSVQTYINESYTELSNYLHAYQNKLHMKREKIADKFLITGKKHYIINVWDNEGVRYSEPKISVTGIEAVKSSTPAFCRDRLNAAFKVLMNYTEEDMIKFVEETKREFFKLSPDEVAFPKGVSDVTKFLDQSSLYKKGTPIHVRGSILYNKSLKKHGLENKYNFITNGEKIKYCYLKMPNPIMENVIGFIQTLPKEFGLHAYVDYETQFDKTFVQPLKAILDIIGWKTEKTITLDQFFI
jgi:DNA polymerase elongation subunit (family B)